MRKASGAGTRRAESSRYRDDKPSGRRVEIYNYGNDRDDNRRPAPRRREDDRIASRRPAPRSNNVPTPGVRRFDPLTGERITDSRRPDARANEDVRPHVRRYDPMTGERLQNPRQTDAGSDARRANPDAAGRRPNTANSTVRRFDEDRSGVRRPAPRKPEPRRYENNRPAARRPETVNRDEFAIRPGKRRKNKLFGSFSLLVVELLALAGILFFIVKNLPIDGGLESFDITQNNEQTVDSNKSTGKQPPSWVQVNLVDEGNPSRTGLPLDGVVDIAVHYTGNPGTTAAQTRNFYNNYDSDVSSHFVIGMEGEAIMCIPMEERSSATNHRNNDTISIEVCHPEADGKFTDASYESLIKLVQWLMEEYNLDTDHVIRHYDVTGKECPRYFVQHPDAWEQFKEDLKSK